MITNVNELSEKSFYGKYCWQAFSSGTHLVHSQHIADVRPWPFLSEQFTCCVQPPWRGILHSPRQGWLLLRRPEEHLLLKDTENQWQGHYSLPVFIPLTAAAKLYLCSQKMSFLPYLQEYFQSTCKLYTESKARICKAVKEGEENIRLLGSYQKRENLDSVCSAVF